VFVAMLCPLTLRQTLRYIRPPETLITQLDVYTEEKYEDEEDMRERASNLFQAGNRYNTSELALTFEELVALTRSRTEEYDKVVRVLKALIPLFQPQSEKYGSQQLCDSLNRHTLLVS
jgi:diaphanous 1